MPNQSKGGHASPAALGDDYMLAAKSASNRMIKRPMKKKIASRGIEVFNYDKTKK
jgi:hypothetical protein